MPQRIVVRVMLRSRRPPSTKLRTSLRRASGWIKIRVLGIPVEKRFLKGRQFEEIVWLGDSFCQPATIGTVFAGLHVHVSIVVNAVLPGVVPGVNETVFAAQFEKPLHGVGVFQVGGANKFIALNAEFVPEGAPLGSHFRNKL